MRIAHITSGLDRYAAGVGVVVAALSAAHHAMGHDVQVFGIETPAWLDGDSEYWRGAPATACHVAGIPRSFGYAPDLPRVLAQFNPDIVHLHGLWMFPALATLNWHRKTSRPYVYSAHGMLSPVALTFSSMKKRVARFLFQDSALSHAAFMHATTPSEADEFRAFGLTNQIAVVPLGIDVAPVPPVAPEAFRRVLSLGRFHPKKGLDRLIRAWAKLEEDFPGWTLDLVGPDEGGHVAELVNLAHSLNVKRIAFRQPLHAAERDACMAAAELFVLPTLSENFALTVAESLMMQTPVIATHGAPWQGLVTERCGWWIEHGVDPLVVALRQAMLMTDEQRHELGSRGRAWMLRDFTWATVAAKMLGVYEEALQVARVPRRKTHDQM